MLYNKNTTMDSRKLCFLICGLPRSIDMIINNIELVFNQTEFITHFYICTSINDDNETQYLNKPDLNLLQKHNTNIKKMLIVKDQDNNLYRNSKNYTNKINNGLNIIDNNYDTYFIIRSDCIINSTNFMQEITDPNKIYFSNENKNPFTKDFNNKINEHIIVSKSYKTIKQLSNFYNFCCNNDNYCDINLYNFIKTNNILIDKLNIDYKLILSKCNVIAISGDSGSGKSSLMDVLLNLYDSNVLKMETDRYHKWERGDENYKKITHLNPNANYLELMSEDVFNLKIGKEIYQVDYDHTSGRFTDKCKIDSKNNIILCGLHTLYNDELNRIFDLKIYMDTDRNLIKKWKIKRDVIERNHSIERVISQIENRTQDYYQYIHNQRNNADIIVNYHETCDCELKCKLIIKNKDIFDKLSPYFIKFNYSINFLEDEFIIELKNNCDISYNDEKIQQILKNIPPQIYSRNNYYCEILAIISLYIYNSDK